MILTKDSIEYLNEHLSIPSTGIEQDWDIELADSNRIDEFIVFYRKKSISSDIKKALMSLIIASYDDYLNENETNNEKYENEIRDLLNSDSFLFKELIYYWSVYGEKQSENYFSITPFIRSISG